MSLLQMSATERGVSARSYSTSTACDRRRKFQYVSLSLLQPTYTASTAALYEDTTQFRSQSYYCIHLEPTVNRNKIHGLCLSRQRARQLYRTRSLLLPGYPVTAAVLGARIKETHCVQPHFLRYKHIRSVHYEAQSVKTI